MRWQLNGILEVSLPDDWQAVTARTGTALVRTTDLALAGSLEAISGLSLFVSHLVPVDGEPPSRLIEALMARRVGQGHPGRSRDRVAGATVQGFDWTDGVADVLTFFARLADGSVVELQLSRAWFPQTSALSLRESAEPVLAGVRWLTDLADPQIWGVWRQDDNGNTALISSGHTRDEAEQIAASFEARGHRQLYWTAPVDEEAG